MPAAPEKDGYKQHTDGMAKHEKKLMRERWECFWRQLRAQDRPKKKWRKLLANIPHPSHCGIVASQRPSVMLLQNPPQPIHLEWPQQQEEVKAHTWYALPVNYAVAKAKSSFTGKIKHRNIRLFATVPPLAGCFIYLSQFERQPVGDGFPKPASI